MTHLEAILSLALMLTTLQALYWRSCWKLMEESRAFYERLYQYSEESNAKLLAALERDGLP